VEKGWQSLGVFSFSKWGKCLATIRCFFAFNQHKNTWQLLGICTVYEDVEHHGGHQEFFSHKKMKHLLAIARHHFRIKR